MIFYFGTFNPIHNGHLHIADIVSNTLGKVIFVPAYDSPWKIELKETYEHRTKMIQLCGKETSDIEKSLPTPSYTYQTIEKLYENLGKINFIIGYDQFFSLEKWKHFEILKEKCHFIVIPRNVKQCTSLNEMKEKGWDFQSIAMNCIDISSSDIRNRVKEGKDIYGLVPKQVESYIKDNKLYKC